MMITKSLLIQNENIMGWKATSVIDGYIHDLYRSHGPEVIVEKLEKDHGIERKRQAIVCRASRLGLKKKTNIEKVMDVGFVKLETPWYNEVIQVVDVINHRLVTCEVEAKCGTKVRLKFAVGRKTCYIDPDTLTVRMKIIATSKFLNLPDSQFYCLRCKTIYDRSFARQKGPHGGNKCKKCYNLGRLEEKRNNEQARIKNYLHVATNNAYLGVTWEGNKVVAKPGTKIHSMIGCTAAEFRKHIEDQFEEGWTHDNRGKVWEIDHIIPYHAYDLTDFEQVKQVMHYTNVRPLSIKDNRKKRAKCE